MSDDQTKSTKYVYRRNPDEGFKRASQEQEKPTRDNDFSKCKIKDECGSCAYINDDYQECLVKKHKAGLDIIREAGVMGYAKALPPVASPRPKAYRAVTKLAVRKNQSKMGDRFEVGLFAPASHKVIDVTQCPLHVASIGRAYRALKVILEETKLEPWDERTLTGDLKYIVLRAAHLTDELMLTFVVTRPLKKELRQIVSRLRETEHNIHAAHMNINETTGNAIFSGRTEKISGGDKLREALCGLDFRISPTAFFQVNPWQAENLYRRVESIVGASLSGDDIAWDLYCGMGQIGMLLAKQGYRVLGIEENPKAIEDAKENAKLNGLEDKMEFVVGRVEDVGENLTIEKKAPSVIVVNPSRRGLAEDVRKVLAARLEENPQTTFVYVSCDINTLARDLKDLTATGHKLRQIESFDMFAQTDKLEWLAVLAK